MWCIIKNSFVIPRLSDPHLSNFSALFLSSTVSMLCVNTYHHSKDGVEVYRLIVILGFVAPLYQEIWAFEVKFKGPPIRGITVQTSIFYFIFSEKRSIGNGLNIVLKWAYSSNNFVGSKLRLIVFFDMKWIKKERVISPHTVCSIKIPENQTRMKWSTNQKIF